MGTNKLHELVVFDVGAAAYATKYSPHTNLRCTH